MLTGKVIGMRNPDDLPGCVPIECFHIRNDLVQHVASRRVGFEVGNLIAHTACEAQRGRQNAPAAELNFGDVIVKGE